MSHLLNNGQVGGLDKSRRSNSHIYDRWERLGFLEGLDRELGMKVSLSYEIAAQIMLMEGKAMDIHFKNTGNVVDDNNRVETIVFPVIRRVLSMFPEAHKYVPEIVNMLKKEYETTLCKALYSGNEGAMIYFYEIVLPKWSKWHKDRKHKYYHDFKKEKYGEYLRKSGNTPSYEFFEPMDWEAEFTACMSDKIEISIREHIKNKEDGK